MTWCSIFFKFVGHCERATPFRSMLFCRRGICGRWPDFGTMMHWRNHRSSGFLGLDRPKIPTSLLVKSQGFHIKSWWFLDVVFHGEIPPKRWAFHGFKPCFPHFFHIKCPVLWRNPSSLCTSVASLVSSEGIWGEFATKGEQWGRRVRIYTEIQRYCIILYCIIYDIYVWICVYIYDYFHIYVYVYIYMVTHTHARGNPPRKHWIFTCQHRLLRRIVCFTPSTLKTKKTMNLGTYPHPTPKYIYFFDLFWGRWFGCFGFLASPPNPK